MSFLGENFYKNVDTAIGPYEWGHWSSRRVNVSGNPFGKLVGSHKFFSEIDEGTAYPNIYIFRDGRSVATSLWRTDNFLNAKTLPLEFSDFLRMKLDWKGSPGYKSVPESTIAQHWCRHLHEWQHMSSENTLLIRYEELLEAPEQIYFQIRNKFFPLRTAKELILPRKKVFLSNKTVGIAPKISSKKVPWEKVFTKDDDQFFRSQVCSSCRGVLDLYKHSLQ